MTSIKDLVSTEIKIKTLDENGNVVSENTLENQIIKEGVGVIGKLLVDPSAPRPSHIYARFATDEPTASSGTNFTLSASDVTYSDFNVATASAGCLRSKIFSTSKLENNDDIANGKITFFFRLTGNNELLGTFSPESSKIYYLGLAASKTISDPSQDLIVSLLSADGLEIPTGGQLAIDYTLKFTV